jgi:hypothetical protein
VRSQHLVCGEERRQDGGGYFESESGSQWSGSKETGRGLRSAVCGRGGVREMCSAGVVLVVRVWGRESDGSRVEARGRGEEAPAPS